jgi:hypothetical protein
MAKKQVYEILVSYEAPDVKKSESADRLITQLFQEGESVIGDLYKTNYIIVDDRYIIPLDYVEKTNKFPYLKKESEFNDTIDRIKAQSVILSEREDERLNQLGSNIKSTIEGKRTGQIKNEAKAYKNGALIGLGCGIITALYFKKSIWVFSLLGVALGGYVAFKVNKAKQGNNIVEPS